VWHRQLYFIDHGAALYFHHHWETASQQVGSPFGASQQHVLLPWASAIEEAGRRARGLLGTSVLREILALVPDAWLEAEGARATERRDAYLEYLLSRLESSSIFEEEAVRGHERLI